MVQLPSGFFEQRAAFDGTLATNPDGSPSYLCQGTAQGKGATCGYHRSFTTTVQGISIRVRYAVTPDFTDSYCHFTTDPTTFTNVTSYSIGCDKTATVNSLSCSGNPIRCNWSVSPGTPADNATIVVSHELGETLTDPDGASGDEIGDTCAERGNAGQGIQAPLYGPLPSAGGETQYLGLPDGGCYLQCSGNAGQCTVEEKPEQLVGVLNGILQ
jgi:hypothetical protein